MEHEGTAHTPFIENPQLELWIIPESLTQTMECTHVVCDLKRIEPYPDAPVITQVVNDPRVRQTDDTPSTEVFRTTRDEVEQWYTTDDLEALDDGFQEREACHSMLSVKDDTNERLPLYCQYVNGRLETVYHLCKLLYEFKDIDTPTQPDERNCHELD